MSYKQIDKQSNIVQEEIDKWVSHTDPLKLLKANEPESIARMKIITVIGDLHHSSNEEWVEKYGGRYYEEVIYEDIIKPLLAQAKAEQREEIKKLTDKLVPVIGNDEHNKSLLKLLNLLNATAIRQEGE